MQMNIFKTIKLMFLKDKLYKKQLYFKFSGINLSVFNLLYQEGHKILLGEFNVVGKQIIFQSFWGFNKRVNLGFNVDYINSFEWLPHLKALDTVDAANCAVKYLGSWCDENNNINLSQEKFNIVSNRVFYWILCAEFINKSNEHEAISKIMGYLHLQSNYFLLNYKKYLSNKFNNNNINIAKTLLIIGLATKNYNYINYALDIIFYNVKLGVFVDGGHINRSPSESLKVLEDLLSIYFLLKEDVLLIRKLNKLRKIIDNITLFIKSLRNTEGLMAVFNGGFEGEKFKIDLLLSLSNVTAKSIIDLKYSGYLNFIGANTRIIFDVGRPLTDYNSLLSNEISIGGSKIITNNGPYKNIYNFDNTNAKSRLDHSCLILENNKNEIVFMPLNEDDLQVVKRTEDSWEIINFTYSGLKQKYGLVYHKRVFLSLTNKDYIIGEELLSFFTANHKINKAYLKFNLNYLAKNLEIIKENSAAVFTIKDNKYYIGSEDCKLVSNKNFYKGIIGHSISNFSLDMPFNLESKVIKLEWVMYTTNPINYY